MKKIILHCTQTLFLIISVNTYAQTGNVGIGTNTPQAKLHVNGELRIDSLKITTDANQVLVVDTITNNIGLRPYFTAIAGDIKQGLQIADHNGWVLLDGRALSTLSSSQQLRAVTLGLTSDLPDAREKYLSYSTSGSSSFGSNSVNLIKENLPTDTFDGTTNYVENNDLNVAQGEFGLIRLSTITDNPNTVSNTDIQGRSVEPDATSTPIDHQHDFSLQLNNAQTAFDNRPATLNVRMFIYLGN
jgi:hypothetical protein